MNIDQIRSRIPTIERRTIASHVQFRQDADKAPRIGMTIPFNSRSEDLGMFVEIIRPTAFNNTLNRDIVSIWNHDPNWVLGRRSNETLQLTVTDKALEGEVTLDPQNPMHQSFARSVERRDVTGTSFGFSTVRDKWTTEADGRVLRELIEVKLYSVDPVVFPAYPESDAEARAIADNIDLAGVKASRVLELLDMAKRGELSDEGNAELREFLRRVEMLIPVPVPVPPEPTVPHEMRLRRLAAVAKTHGIAA